jgi:hypothetical protein
MGRFYVWVESESFSFAATYGINDSLELKRVNFFLLDGSIASLEMDLFN